MTALDRMEERMSHSTLKVDRSSVAGFLSKLAKPSASESLRIGKYRNDFRETKKRIRIPVCQNEWERIEPFTAFVNEMNANIVHVGLEVREFVERLFVHAPRVAPPDDSDICSISIDRT